MNGEELALMQLQKSVADFPSMVVMLGSGWNKVMEKVEVEVEIPYKDLFGVEASVPGHEGKLVVGSLASSRVVFMNGRLHMYEGYTSWDATLPIRVFAKVGMTRLVVTSAAGAINEHYRVGDFVILNDMLTLLLSFDPPLSGSQFLDLSEPFDAGMRERAKKILVQEGLSFREGTYCFIHGPNFETPADKMALKSLGADVVGMSTVPETMMARWLGVRVLGLSFVTNLAFVTHAHEDVLAAADAGSVGMGRMIEKIAEIY